MEPAFETSYQFCETPLDLAHPETPVYPAVPLPAGWEGCRGWKIYLLYDHSGTPDMVVWGREIYRQVAVP